MPHQKNIPSPRPELKPFQRKMYALYDELKQPQFWCLSLSEGGCYRRYEETFGEPWKIGSQRGYVVAEVIVSIIPVISKSSTDE